MTPCTQPTALTFHCMTDAMFEPGNWRSFKSFVVRVRERAEEASAASRLDWGNASLDRDSSQLSNDSTRGRPVLA